MIDQDADCTPGALTQRFVLFSLIVLIICILPFIGYFSPYGAVLFISAIAAGLTVLIFAKGPWFGVKEDVPKFVEIEVAVTAPFMV